MKKSTSKVGTFLIILSTIVLAGVAVFTAYRLYQLRQQPVAPNVPSSVPKAAETSKCQLSFNMATVTVTSTPTATPSGSPTATPTPTGTATPTATATSTAAPTGSSNSCGGTCGSNLNCASGLYCYSGFCRNPSCPSQTDCNCPGATPTPTTVAASLPKSGIGWPTLVGTGFGIFVILGAIVLAL